MKKTLPMGALLLCVLFSSGCESSPQPRKPARTSTHSPQYVYSLIDKQYEWQKDGQRVTSPYE